MQPKEIGHFFIELPRNSATKQSNNNRDKQDDTTEQTDSTTYERMELVEEFDFDNAIHPGTMYDTTPNTADIYT